MNTKKISISLTIALSIIIILFSVQNNKLVQAKMSRFGDAKNLVINEADLSKITQDTKLDNSKFGFITVKTTLENIWGKRAIKQESGIQACPDSQIAPEIFYAQEIKDKNLQILKKYETSGVQVVIISPNDISLATPEIKGGIELINAWLKWSQTNIYKYPCDQIVIFTHAGYAAGSPGKLGIGGFGGINHYWLLWHELTHSYFGTHSSNSLWLREGPSVTVPTIMLEELINQIKWDEQNLKPQIPNIQSTLNDFTTKYGKVYSGKNACDLKEPEESTDQNYVDNSNWGRIFLFDLSLKYGSKTVIESLSTVYAKYRYTGLTKISDQDFYDAFLYFVSKNNKTAVDKYTKAQALLKQKLCL